ncbi:MAG: Wzz/FepE/Etk N-terminal domain-containing protein [Breznakibacter sp.]
MTDEKSVPEPIVKDDEIDLLALVRTIWAGRKIILYTSMACVVVGLIIAFTSPKKYTTSATLLPSSERKSGNLGSLSALAGMAGINVGGMLDDASGVPTELYPQVVASVPYLMELMHKKFYWERFRANISIYEVAQRDTVVSAFAIIKKYTIGLPFTLKNAIFPPRTNDVLLYSKSHEGESYYVLTDLERKAMSRLKGAVHVEYDKKNGLVVVSVTMNEPLLCAQLADKAVQLLQKHVIDYRIRQSVENLQFIEERFAESKKRYEEAQWMFFGYKDAHRNIVAERMDVEYQRLSDAYDIASAIYKNLAQQLEQAKITVKEETPVFKVLDPVVVPKDAQSKKSMILVISIFFGVFLGILAVFVSNIYINIRVRY